jgi:hypothetical protein
MRGKIEDESRKKRKEDKGGNWRSLRTRGRKVKNCGPKSFVSYQLCLGSR